MTELEPLSFEDIKNEVEDKLASAKFELPTTEDLDAFNTARARAFEGGKFKAPYDDARDAFLNALIERQTVFERAALTADIGDTYRRTQESEKAQEFFDKVKTIAAQADSPVKELLSMIVGTNEALLHYSANSNDQANPAGNRIMSEAAANALNVLSQRGRGNSEIDALLSHPWVKGRIETTTRYDIHYRALSGEMTMEEFDRLNDARKGMGYLPQPGRDLGNAKIVTARVAIMNAFKAASQAEIRTLIERSYAAIDDAAAQYAEEPWGDLVKQFMIVIIFAAEEKLSHVRYTSIAIDSLLGTLKEDADNALVRSLDIGNRRMYLKLMKEAVDDLGLDAEMNEIEERLLIE